MEDRRRAQAWVMPDGLRPVRTHFFAQVDLLVRWLLFVDMFRGNDTLPLVLPFSPVFISVLRISRLRSCHISFLVLFREYCPYPSGNDSTTTLKIFIKFTELNSRGHGIYNFPTTGTRSVFHSRHDACADMYQ